MRQATLFTKTFKTTPKDEPSKNAQLLIRAGFVDKLMAGVYTLLPLGQLVMQNIAQIIREEMASIAGQEIKMPALTPKENWLITDRWDKMEVLFKLTGAGEKEYALGSTHEEVVTPLVKKFVQSYKDLPLAVFQIQDKFRNEPRTKSGLLRGREFSMKDLYSFHTSQDDLNQYYERARQAYLRVFKRCSLDAKVVEASGGVFSKYSHEFQVFTEYGEDTVYSCTQCHIHQNKEIVTEQLCQQCGSPLVQHKAIEVGNIFKLGSRFSEPFSLTYVDEQGKIKPVLMGCYGIGLSRLLGTIAEIHHDDAGLKWPETVAPFKFHLINLNKNSVQSDQVYNALQKNQLSVLYDDRLMSVGVKLNDADLIGLPHQLIVGSKHPGNVEYKNRSSKHSEIISLDELLKRYV